MNYKMRCIYEIFLVICVTGSRVYGAEERVDKIEIHMPLVETQKADQYLCYAKLIDEVDEAFVESSTTVANREVVHHVATGVCEQPASTEEVWDCTASQGKVCNGAAVNFGGWDEFTVANGQFVFPENVTLRVGKKTNLKYFITEIHYSEPVKDPKESAANITLQLSKTGPGLNYQTYSLVAGGYIPGNTSNGIFTEIGCPWTRPPAYAYRYFLHTHHYGYLVEGFLVRNETWTLLGSQLSMGKAKDLFDIPGGPILIQPGDAIAARCLYINSGPTPVKFGMSEAEEMCNFQVDIAYDLKDEDSFARPPACKTDSPDFSFCNIKSLAGVCG